MDVDSLNVSEVMLANEPEIMKPPLLLAIISPLNVSALLYELVYQVLESPPV